MENRSFEEEKKPSTHYQLKLISWGAQIAALGYIIYMILFDQNAVDNTNPLYFRLDLILFSCVFVVASLLLIVLNQRIVESLASSEKRAGSDGLTGLLNRNGAEVSYQKLLKKINPNHECIIIYFMDLDDFKNINALFDHYVGDELLKTNSSRLSSLTGEDGFACRFGGDEFVLAIRAEQDFDDEGFAEELLKAIAQPHSILGVETEVTTSLGIVKVSDIQSSFSSICKKADIALTKAKQSGKNTYCCYSDKLQGEYMRNLNIVSCLKNAISNNLLELYFQPKINLQTNKVEGVEALLRWARGNPEGIGPDEFIPVIESTALIHSIGDWVINEACISCKKMA